MSVHMTNLKEFNDMLTKRLALASKKTHAAITNKACLTVLLGSSTGPGAVKTTRAATKGGITKDLGKKYHGFTFTGKSHAVKLIFLLASKALVKAGVKFLNWKDWNTQVAIMAQRIANARFSSASFLRAGWLAAAADLGAVLGARPVGLRVIGGKPRPGSRASKGRAVVATPERLRAIAYNNAVEERGGGRNDPAAYLIAQEGLNLAIANAKRDIEIYVVRKEIEAMFGKEAAKGMAIHIP